MMTMSSRVDSLFFLFLWRQARAASGHGMAWHAHKCFEQDRKGKKKGERKEHVTAGSAHTRSGIPLFFKIHEQSFVTA